VVEKLIELNEELMAQHNELAAAAAHAADVAAASAAAAAPPPTQDNGEAAQPPIHHAAASNGGKLPPYIQVVSDGALRQPPSQHHITPGQLPTGHEAQPRHDVGPGPPLQAPMSHLGGGHPKAQLPPPSFADAFAQFMASNK
jgi:hypothetical protein